jgi:hypothetical protein
MSQTEPMEEADRIINYEQQALVLSGGESRHRATKTGFTSRQRRRLKQKCNATLGRPEAVEGIPAFVDEFLDHPETGVQTSRPAKKEVSE